jgi:NAD+ synthase
MSQEVAQRTSDWIKQYASRAKVESLVVGISGGIDSAVVSTLCCMTGINTYLVSMPIKQNKEHLKRAHDHTFDLVKRFPNAKRIEIDLTEHFNLFENSLLSTELSLANTRSRLRMTMLYQVASNCMGIVVGTGNKIEDFGVGFFTKYGDGGVDISPIADFTKTEVRALAKELEIIQEIQDAKPSDGLWDSEGKDDEDQLGATYEELEIAMKYADTNPFFTSAEFDSLPDREREVLSIYLKRHRANLHKMNPIPVFTLPTHLKYMTRTNSTNTI